MWFDRQMTRTTTAKRSALSVLPPESFGRKMRRAREDVAELTLSEAAEGVNRWMVTSAATIGRLEQLEHPPGDRRRRQLAYTACVVYGIDPVQLGLSVEGIPAGALPEVPPSSAWLTGVDPGFVSPRMWEAAAREEFALAA